jgi:tripartite-type tricarboxylate transporter receptor subunit TctC
MMGMTMDTTMRAATIFPAMAAAVALAALGTRVAAAQDDDFYKGKTITIVVGYSAGGGYDQYARTFARYFPHHLTGNPTVLVQNMPGAATLTSVRYLDATAPKDGTVITMFDPGLITESFAAPETFKIKFSDYRWIGSMLRDIRVCYAWGATGVKNWADLMARKEFLIGATSRGANAYVNGAILRKILNAPVRQIPGYAGSNEQRLAVERGELEGACASWSSIPQEWIADHKINALVRFSPERPADMPETIPYVADLVTTKEQKDLLAILGASGELGRPLIVSRAVPIGHAQMLRAAFEATMNDPGFKADAERQSLPLDLVTGAEAEKIVEQIYTASPDLAKQVEDVLK